MAPKRISAAELAEQQSVNKRLKIACVLCLTFMVRSIPPSPPHQYHPL